MTFRIKFYDFDSEFHNVFIFYLAIPGNIHLPMDHTDMGTQIVQDFQEKQQQDSKWFEWFSWNFGQNSQNVGEIN